MKILVTGASGLIGSHLVSYLKERGHWVRGVDIKEPDFAESDADQFLKYDLRDLSHIGLVMNSIDVVFALAAYRGGMGIIADPEKQIDMWEDNMRINMNTLQKAARLKMQRYVFASSACVYPEYLQNSPTIKPLKEEDAWPAQPQGMYGLEKLATEELCLCYKQTFGLPVAILRFHNTYGRRGSIWDGRGKVIDDACRKIAVAKLTGNHEVTVWGDGQATRSYMYIDDCIEGLYRMMQSDETGPLNLGRDRMISVNDLYDMIAEIAGIEIEKVHDLTKPEGVRGRNSDNSRLRGALNWEPSITIEEGLAKTYSWIEKQVRKKLETFQVKPVG